MTPFAILVDVADAERRDPTYRRVAGLLPDNETVAVATKTAEGTIANGELTFKLNEANALAEAVLAGDARARTTPGLARILSASVAVLFRVCHAAGALQAIQKIEDADAGDDDTGHLGDRPEAGEDENPDA